MKANDLLSQFGDHRQRVQSAITSVCEGRGILLVDDENRENEGDLIFSAQSMTEADMAIMIRHCSGIVCLCSHGGRNAPTTETLPLMVDAKRPVNTGTRIHHFDRSSRGSDHREYQQPTAYRLSGRPLPPMPLPNLFIIPNIYSH